MSNTIQIKSGTTTPKKGDLAPNELGIDTRYDDLYVGGADGTPKLIIESIVGRAIRAKSGKIDIQKTVLSLTTDKLIVTAGNFGEDEPSGTGTEGQLYFRIVE